MEILALIPARGGSKSIPRKNLLRVAGKPLIAYSIEQARAARNITRVIVSTDDPEIAQVARDCAAEVPFLRPPEFAQDLSPDLDVFRHALTWLEENENYTCELVVHLRPTGPVRRVELIDAALDLMRAHPEADSLRAVSLAEHTPYKMWRLEGEFLTPLLRLPGVPEPHSLPRQLLPKVYWQNGYVDVVRPRTILELNSMVGRKVLPFMIHDPILELDYPETIPQLEEALKQLARGEWGGPPPEPDRYSV